MEHQHDFGEWLSAVETIDPRLAKPEVWTDADFIESVVFKNKQVRAVLQAMTLTTMRTPDVIVGALSTALLLGFLMGRQHHIDSLN